MTTDRDSHSELRVENTDPLRTVLINDDPSTFMKSSNRQSVKQDLDSIKIKRRILTSSRRLKFIKWQYILFVSSLLLIAVKIFVKLQFDISVQKLYNYEKQTNLIANSLRPISFIYKETVKQQAADILGLSSDSRFDKDYEIMHYYDRLTVQIVQTMNYYNGDKMNTQFSFRPECKLEMTQYLIPAYPCSV